MEIRLFTESFHLLKNTINLNSFLASSFHIRFAQRTLCVCVFLPGNIIIYITVYLKFGTVLMSLSLFAYHSFCQRTVHQNIQNMLRVNIQQKT